MPNHFVDFFTFLSSEKNYSKHTIGAYKRDLGQFFDFLHDTHQTDNEAEVTPSMIRTWVVHMMQDNQAPTSIARKVSTTKSYYRFLLSKGIVKTNPAVKSILPKKAKRLPVFVEKNDINQVLDGLWEDAKTIFEKQEALIVELFYLTGIRLSELIGLTKKDVDFYSEQILVRGKGNKQRMIPLTKGVMHKIKVFQEQVIRENCSQVDNLFITKKGNTLYPQFVYRLVNKCLDSVSGIAKKSPHVLRHTFATHMLSNGADINSIKTLLGHESLAATQVYTHNTISKLKGVHKQAHPRG